MRCCVRVPRPTQVWFGDQLRLTTTAPWCACVSFEASVHDGVIHAILGKTCGAILIVAWLRLAGLSGCDAGADEDGIQAHRVEHSQETGQRQAQAQSDAAKAKMPARLKKKKR